MTAEPPFPLGHVADLRYEGGDFVVRCPVDGCGWIGRRVRLQGAEADVLWHYNQTAALAVDRRYPLR